MVEKFKRINITLPPSIAKELAEIRDSTGVPISVILRKGFEERMREKLKRFR